MISDSIPNASIAMASSNPKDFAKKKRGNRTAKLKQCKLDARREQWLSQVKNKGGCKVEVNGGRNAPGGPLLDAGSERGRQIEKLEIKQRGEEEIYGDGISNHYSDSEFSPSNSPTSHTSSALGSNGSGLNFTASSRSNSSHSSRSSSTSSNGCYSESMSEEEEGDVGDDGCLDDWEAVADALAASDNKQQAHGPESGKHGNVSQSNSKLDVTNQLLSGVDFKSESGGTATQSSSVNCRAWRPDDAFRPQSLPNLAKQHSFPLKSERQFGHGGVAWDCKNVAPVPTSCPICCEDLDLTDSSFLPCLCGFRLCLFCHKRILEQDARCPGCRKRYESGSVEGEAKLEGGTLASRLGRSCSMITRA